MGVVQRRRRNPDHVGLAPVAQHAVAGQVAEQVAAGLAAAQAAAADHPQRQLAAALGRIGRGHDVEGAGQARADQLFQVAGQAQGFLAQGAHADPIEQLQRRAQGRQPQHRRIAELPALGARGRHEIRTHQEPAGGIVAPPAGEARQLAARMALVDEAAGDRAGAGVEVFVMAPHREIRAAVVQAEFQVADAVGEVEAAQRALRVRQPRDLAQVEGLAAAVLHARPQHQRQARAVLGDRALDARHRNQAAGLVGRHFDQVGVRVEAVEGDLRSHRVAVGRKSAGLDQHRRALAGRPVEADHHQVQVGGERVHRDHLRRFGADQARERFAHQFVVGHPLGLAGEMAFDRLGRPLVHHIVDAGARAARLQAERVADEISLFAPAVARDQEFAAQGRQGVGGVERGGMVGRMRIGHEVRAGSLRGRRG